MFRLSLRSPFALLIGVAMTVSGVAYAVPSTPAPTPESSITAAETPAEPVTAQFQISVIKEPTHPFDHAKVEVRKGENTAFVLTTSYGHQERLAASGTPLLTVFLPAPDNGWQPARAYTVTATPEAGQAHRVTFGMRNDGAALDYRVTITRPAKSTDPLRIQLHGVKVGAPVTIAVGGFDFQGQFAYIETKATSSSPRWTIHSGDGVQVTREHYRRWDPTLTYIVQVTVGGTGEDAPSWSQSFRVSDSAPAKPTKALKPGERDADHQGGLASTGR